jgi:hypothetical protein
LTSRFSSQRSEFCGCERVGGDLLALGLRIITAGCAVIAHQLLVGQPELV